MTPRDARSRNAWLWVPSLYFAEGIPYVVVMLVSVIMYKRLGVSNTEIALYTSWLYLPWVIKPLWSPFVDNIKTRRGWILVMQLLIGAGLAGVALTIPAPDFLRYSLAFLWLLAFSSATHDIAADGFYMLGLSTHDQAWFVGIRSTFYRLAMITGQGLLVIFAGYMESTTGLPTREFEVHAVGSPSQTEQVILPDTLRMHVSDDETREIALIPARLEISIGKARHGAVDSILATARQRNLQYGFVRPDEPVSRAGTETDEDVSVWTRYVSSPLERWLSSNFGADVVATSGPVGKVGIVYVGLTQPVESGQTIAVNLGLESGDKSIRLVEGQRLEFSEANAHMVAAAVFQLDPKLDKPSAAVFSARSGNVPLAWSLTFYLLSGLFVIAFVYHRFALPRPKTDIPGSPDSNVLAGFVETFASFFRKPGVAVTIAFFLFYRFAEAQLVKLASPFLLDLREVGGLALTTGEVGFAYGTVGVLALTIGGLLGGFLAARNGLRFWLWPMVVAINLPNVVYLYLAYTTPESLAIINVCVAIEQFGYGFGFTAFMLYMIYAADGPHKTAHFAICTGFMALGMMIPGMFSGWLQDIIGYRSFFTWIMIATIPGFIVSALIRIDKDFGKNTDEGPGDAREEPTG